MAFELANGCSESLLLLLHGLDHWIFLPWLQSSRTDFNNSIKSVISILLDKTGILSSSHCSKCFLSIYHLFKCSQHPSEIGLISNIPFLQKKFWLSELPPDHTDGKWQRQNLNLKFFLHQSLVYILPPSSSGKGKSSAFDLIMLIRNSIILQKTVLGSRLKKIKDQFLSGPVTSSVLGISVGIEIAIWSDLGNLQSGY